jgi:hypothetical protein
VRAPAHRSEELSGTALKHCYQQRNNREGKAMGLFGNDPSSRLYRWRAFNDVAPVIFGLVLIVLAFVMADEGLLASIIGLGAIAVLGYLIVPLLKISRSSDDPLSRIWALVLVFLLVCVGSDLLDGSNFV